MKKQPIQPTSWGGVAEWYDELLEKQAGTYQKELILPNLLRLMEIRQGETVLDIACGQGFFSRAFRDAGADVMASDISRELVKIAGEREREADVRGAHREGRRGIVYHVAPADRLAFARPGSAEKAVIVLAIQNIENMAGVFKECARVLAPQGRLYIVMNHPAFRIPKRSSWGFDERTKVQYRRIDAYLSESNVKIQMHPGASPGAYTISFHRPIQVYAKALSKAGFAIRRLEEWNSQKKSGSGPRAATENRARKEIPLFLAIEAQRCG